jgi:hypothetical protein
MRVGVYDSFVGLSFSMCQFTVTADVVPLELTLSQKELTMQFAEDSVESTVSETIIMENPGTHHIHTWDSREAVLHLFALAMTEVLWFL